jgi:hypothetical protein
MVYRQKILLCALILSQITLLSHTPMDRAHAQHLNSWKTSYVDKMSVPERQMCANIVLAMLSLAIIEGKTQQFTTPIARINQDIRVKIDQIVNPTDDIAMLKTLLERLSFVISTRTIYTHIMSICLQHYNQNPTTVISEALQNLQEYAQAELRNWADENIGAINESLRKCAENSTHSMKYFEQASAIQRTMSNGILPMAINPDENPNRSLMTVSIILRDNPGLVALSESMINSFNHTSDQAAQIIHTGTNLYKQFYTVLYHSLQEDQPYATTLFSMHGLLPDEYKSLLPEPDHVFEHMLQTTKLYTQSEFLPS